jgi:hypothetical protein
MSSKLVALALPVLMLCVASAGGTDGVRPADLRATDVAVFKHGFGFVLAEGTGDAHAGWVCVAPVPQASLGTLWLYSPASGVTVDRAVAEIRPMGQKREVTSLRDLLAANVGRKVTLYVGREYRQETAMTGILQPPIWAEPSRRSRDNSYQMTEEQLVWAAVPPREDEGERTISDVVLKTPRGQEVIPIATVTRVSFPAEANRDGETVKPQQALTARLVSGGRTVPDGPVALGMGYMAKGLRWIPAYRLQLTGDGQGRLQLQGNVINDVADLKDSRLHLVVGVPHFVQEDVISPLSLQIAWTKLSAYFTAARGSQRDAYSNAIMASQVPGPAGPLGPPTPGQIATGQLDQAAVTGVSGEGVEELFFYTVPDVTITRGSRALVSIMDESVTYEDVYLWRVADDPEYARRQWSPTYTRQQQAPRTPEQEALEQEWLNPKVWHALRLKNGSKAPWTTAPALVIKGWQPISQSMLLYTPVGGTVDLTTTVAPDIASQRTDLEVGRQSRAITVSSHVYDLVKVKGELRLRNHKAQAVRVIVKRELEGAVEETSEGGTAAKLARGAAGLNPVSQITWDLSLAPGAERVMTYTYSVYVRI